MAVSTLTVLGVKALTANYAALQTTGHNIANANVAGFSRQQAEFATAPGQFTGSGYFGLGVNVTTVSRAHNVFLAREATAASSLAAMDAARMQQLGRLEGLFRTGEGGLAFAATAFLNSFAELANRPADPAMRQVVLARSRDMASRFADTAGALDTMQANLQGELQETVATVNGLARSIAAINQQMVGLRSLGQPPNDLLDERDRLIGRLGDLVQVSRVDSADGTVGIFIGGGQRLVLGAQASELALRPDTADPGRLALGIREGTAVRDLGGTLLGGGRLAGMLRFQNEDLVDARNLLGRMAAVVGEAVNRQQAVGLSLRSDADNAPPPFFQLGAPRALAHGTNTLGPDGRPLGQVTLAIDDPGQLKPSSYLLEPDPDDASQWRITRLVAGQPSRDPTDRMSFAAGPVTFQGMTLDFGNPPPQPGDRFTLQPVARAANGMRALLDDPRDIAAASPLLAFAAAGNTGTAAVASLGFSAASAIPLPQATTRITFTDDAGGYAWELLDENGVSLGAGAGTWQAGQPIPAPPDEINGFSLQLSGVPRAGDVLTVQPTPPQALAANNGNALQLAALRDAALSEGRTLTDTYAMVLSDVGVRVQGARTAADISGNVARQAEAARSSVAGVNLDEEAARLIQFQQSYQAAAKVLQVAQTLLDAVLQTTGR
jgi:flagellar hook-associated protein 1 FlgK